MVPRVSMRLLWMAIALAVALVPCLAAPPKAEAGMGIMSFCQYREAGWANGPAYYNGADGIDDWEYGWNDGSGEEWDHISRNYDGSIPYTGWIMNPRDADYPGVDTSARSHLTNPNQDISGWSNEDVFDIYHWCYEGGGVANSQAISLQAEDGDAGSSMIRNGGLRSARIRFDAPDANPYDAYDSGWYYGFYTSYLSTGNQTSGGDPDWIQWNLNPKVIVRVNWPDAAGAYSAAYGQNLIFTKNCASPQAAYWRNQWVNTAVDFADGAEYQNYYSGTNWGLLSDSVGTDGQTDTCAAGGIAPWTSAYQPFGSFSFSLSCNSYGQQTCPTHASDANNQDTTAYLRHILLYNWDRENPTLHVSGALQDDVINNEVWHRAANSYLWFQMADSGNGLDNVNVLVNGQNINASSPFYWDGHQVLGKQFCRTWSSSWPEPVHDAAGWRVFDNGYEWNENTFRGFSTGPCRPFLTVPGWTQNTAAGPWGEGLNTLNINANDLAIAANEDPYASLGWARIHDPNIDGSFYDYHTAANSMSWSRGVYVDNRKPVPSATSLTRSSLPSMIGTPPSAAEQDPWLRSTVTPAGSAVDSNAATSTISGVATTSLERLVGLHWRDDFEQSVSDWTATAATLLQGSGYQSNHSMRLNGIAGPAAPSAWTGVPKIQDVTAGKKYEASAWVRALDASATATIQITFFDSSWNVLVNHNSIPASVSTDAFTKVNVLSQAAPANAVKARIRITFNGGGDLDDFLADEVVLEDADTGWASIASNNSSPSDGAGSPPTSGTSTVATSATQSTAGTWCDGIRVNYRIRGTDIAGNTETSAPFSRVVDNSAPLDTSSTPNAGEEYPSFTVTVAANDQRGTEGSPDCPQFAGSGVHHVEWELIDQSNGNAVVQSGSSTVDGQQQVLINLNRYAVRTYTVDNAGNRSPPRLIDPLIDSTPPTLSVSGSRSGWLPNYDDNQTITFTAQDVLNSVTRIDWLYLSGTNGSEQINCPAAPCGHAPAQWQPTQSFTAEGIFNLSATARDTAENVSNQVGYSVRIDKRSPTIQITSHAAIDYGDALRAEADDRNSAIAHPRDVSGPVQGWFEICPGATVAACPNPPSTEAHLDSSSYVQAGWARLDQDAVGGTLDSPCVAPDAATGTGSGLAPQGGVQSNYVCNIDTSTLEDGAYMLRFRGFDLVGNGSWSPPQLIDVTQREICVLP